MNARLVVCSSLLCCLGLLSTGCASTGAPIDAPSVDLASVELQRASFRSQTFLLGFDVNNPNPFPLPVKTIRYSVWLGDHKFARGETQCDLLVPADGRDEFSISVEIDILKTAGELTSVIRDGLADHVEYELQGSLGVDIPLVKPVPFSSTGVIRLRSDRLRSQTTN